MISVPNRLTYSSEGPPLVGGVLVVVSIAASVLGMRALPERIRIHWSLGAGPYYGPEFAPVETVLALFPVVVATLFVGAGLVEASLDGTEEFEPVRPYYEWAAVSTLAVVLGVQLLVVWLNLP
jgi:hypothetical protein